MDKLTRSITENFIVVCTREDVAKNVSNNFLAIYQSNNNLPSEVH